MIIGNLGEQADSSSTYDWILLGESSALSHLNFRVNGTGVPPVWTAETAVPPDFSSETQH
jgi:hypothetical protein